MDIYLKTVLRVSVTRAPNIRFPAIANEFLEEKSPEFP